MLFVFSSICILVLIGMTYEFITRILSMGLTTNFGKCHCPHHGKNDGGSQPPMETSPVPAKPTKPDDVLEGAEEIPSDDGDSNEIEYIYKGSCCPETNIYKYATNVDGEYECKMNDCSTIFGDQPYFDWDDCEDQATEKGAVPQATN